MKIILSSVMIFFVALFCVSTVAAQSDEDDDFIVPVRPSVSESANIQKKGVLQIETGADFDFAAPDFRHSQTESLGLYYAATRRFRLDFELETFASEKDRPGGRKTGVGDLSVGFKTVLRDAPDKQLAAAFSYSVKLPTASAEKNLGTGKVDHNLRLILDRSIGKNDYTLNVSYLNVGREMTAKRDSGAQVIVRYDRKLTKRLELINEIYGNTVDEDQPRGIYLNEAITYKIGKRLQLDVGARPGFGRDAPHIAIFAGIVIGIGRSK